MRRQFVLDKKSSQLLDELAETRAGNRSLVVREAIGLFAATSTRSSVIPRCLRMWARFQWSQLNNAGYTPGDGR